MCISFSDSANMLQNLLTPSLSLSHLSTICFFFYASFSPFHFIRLQYFKMFNFLQHKHHMRHVFVSYGPFNFHHTTHLKRFFRSSRAATRNYNFSIWDFFFCSFSRSVQTILLDENDRRTCAQSEPAHG